jgi:hypothetical protein
MPLDGEDEHREAVIVSYIQCSARDDNKCRVLANETGACSDQDCPRRADLVAGIYPSNRDHLSTFSAFSTAGFKVIDEGSPKKNLDTLMKKLRQSIEFKASTLKKGKVLNILFHVD